MFFFFLFFFISNFTNNGGLTITEGDDTDAQIANQNYPIEPDPISGATAGRHCV